jgi:hypothetical protein
MRSFLNNIVEFYTVMLKSPIIIIYPISLYLTYGNMVNASAHHRNNLDPDTIPVDVII